MKSNRSILNEINTIPNYITILRLLSIPVLWIFFNKGLIIFIGIGMILGSLSDLLDGYLARKLDQTTSLGSKLDTLADNLLLASACIWLYFLKPEVITNNKTIFAAWIVLYAISILIGIIKFKCFPHLHLYSSKIATGACYTFFIITFLFDCASDSFFIATLCLAIVSRTEIIVILLIESEYKDNVGSILNIFKK